ncbi:hypothetical protein KAZ01_03905 [Candidatus Gracilibacteria bacterium]|nr:hypothetical protein [Candidatus Gracilibacteria bacterium]
MNNSTNVYNKNSINFELIIKNCLQDNSLYIKLNKEDKQEFWNTYFRKIVWYDKKGTQLPVSIENLRVKYFFENNFNIFIPGIIKSLEEEGFSGTIYDIFILDNETQLFFNIRLIENLGDLYYNTLADFLEKLSNIIGNEKLNLAYEKITIAWKISEPYVDKNNSPQKHKNAESEIRFLGGIHAIAERVGKMNNTEMGKFLLALSEKIWNDGEKDNNRPSIGKNGVISTTKKRIKLATTLFETSLLLKEVSTELEKKD